MPRNTSNREGALCSLLVVAQEKAIDSEVVLLRAGYRSRIFAGKWHTPTVPGPVCTASADDRWVVKSSSQ